MLAACLSFLIRLQVGLCIQNSRLLQSHENYGKTSIGFVMLVAWSLMLRQLMALETPVVSNYRFVTVQVMDRRNWSKQPLDSLTRLQRNQDSLDSFPVSRQTSHNCLSILIGQKQKPLASQSNPFIRHFRFILEVPMSMTSRPLEGIGRLWLRLMLPSECFLKTSGDLRFATTMEKWCHWRPS